MKDLEYVKEGDHVKRLEFRIHPLDGDRLSGHHPKDDIVEGVAAPFPEPCLSRRVGLRWPCRKDAIVSLVTDRGLVGLCGSHYTRHRSGGDLLIV